MPSARRGVGSKKLSSRSDREIAPWNNLGISFFRLCRNRGRGQWFSTSSQSRFAPNDQDARVGHGSCVCSRRVPPNRTWKLSPAPNKIISVTSYLETENAKGSFEHYRRTSHCRFDDSNGNWSAASRAEGSANSCTRKPSVSRLLWLGA